MTFEQDTKDYKELMHTISTGRWLIDGQWALGFVALLAGGYLTVSYAGLLLAAGFCLIARALAKDLKMQVYPMSVWAMLQLDPSYRKTK
jgi:hypothetical protein